MNDSPKDRDRASWTNFFFRLARHKMLLLMLGGAIGTLTRYEVGRWIASQPWAQTGFPYGTFVINVTGSFILAMAAVLLQEHFTRYADWFLLVGTGFCGGYTTFSTFEWETYKLVQNGSYRLAMVNVVGSIVAGFLGVMLAVFFVRLVLPNK